MKKIFAVIAAVTALFTMAACTDKGGRGMVKNEKIQLEVGEVKNIAPADAGKSAVVYESSDENVIAVADGDLIALSEGVASVTAKYGSNTLVVKATVTPNEFGTTHVKYAKESEIKLVENGKCDYVIVYDADETDELIKDFAVSEMQYFFEEATGIKLRATDDSKAKYSASSKYISIGNTSVADAAGVAPSGLLTINGVQIVTKDQSVFLQGGGRFGTLYSVYEFLKQQFGYEQYAVDEFKIDRGVTDCNLKFMRVFDLPDFEWRLGNNGEYWYGTEFPSRMRMQKIDDIWIKLGGEPWHNYMGTIPKDVYQAEHPDWYSPDGQQLCLTRDVAGLSEEVFRRMKIYIEANPYLSNITFTQMDVNVWCTCPSCTAMREQYGVNSASNIKFINIVARKVKEWLAQEHPDRQLTICIFAYHAVEEAPAMYNIVTDEYEPIDDSVVLEDNVALFYAPIFANYYYGCDHPQNEKLDTTMKKWQALTDKIYLWIYSNYFGDYLMPYDSMTSMQEKYIYARENNVRYLFDQEQHNQAVGTSWFRLKEYLSSRLAWDVHANPQELTRDFFDHYFQQAAPAMNEYYDEFITYFAYLAEHMGYSGNIGEYIVTTRHFPQGVPKKWLGIIDKAFDAIEPLKAEDPELYTQLYDRILLETLTLRYVDLTLYESTYTPEEFKQKYQSFVADSLRLGLTNWNEWVSFTDHFNRYQEN